MSDQSPGFSRQRVLRIACWTFIVVSFVVAIQVPGIGWTVPYGDGWNYLAAGERLNAGHALYALGPGDREVLIVPPYWTAPLLAPPPIAVVWRPLALLGDASMLAWGIACALCVVLSVGAVIRAGHLWLVAVLGLPLALLAMSGNFSAMVIPLLLLAWRWRDRPWRIGACIAVTAAVKITPIVFVVWLAATGRWRALGATVIVLLAIGAVSLVVVGMDAWWTWLSSAGQAAPAPLAISTLTGLPTIAVAVLLAVPILVAYRLPRVGFGFAVVAAALATPALYFTALATLVALPFGRRGMPDKARTAPPSDRLPTSPQALATD